MKRGIATFTLDEGKCPRWLFERMVKLGKEILEILINEYGPNEFVKRMGDPVWFQSLGTVLAFDWNASGLTTTLTAALKEAIKGRERELGIFICGGKGKTSRKTPEEILMWGEKIGFNEKNTNILVYNSKMAAKVDNTLVQDGFQIYHHTFIFSKSGEWTVIQQGMNINAQKARRYHWYSKRIENLLCEPHSGIVASNFYTNVLNLVAKESEENKNLTVQIVNGNYRSLMKDLTILRKHFSSLLQTVTFQNKNKEQLTLLNLEPIEFKSHPVLTENFLENKYLDKILNEVVFQKPENYEKLVALKGVGPKTIRALSLVGEVIYGAKPSYTDPARYSFAHGGKDATPYPVDLKTYDETIGILKNAIRKSKLNLSEKQRALKRLEFKF
jgi:hypothetical protein